MQPSITQSHTDRTQQLASPSKGSTIRTRKLQNMVAAKMGLDLRIFNSLHS